MDRNEFKTKMLEAIDKAESPGACNYVRIDDDGKYQPECVIAQFAALACGVTMEEMRFWRRDKIESLIRHDRPVGSNKLPNSEAEIDVMGKVQLVWDKRIDGNNNVTADERKAKMREIVEQYVTRRHWVNAKALVSRNYHPDSEAEDRAIRGCYNFQA